MKKRMFKSLRTVELFKILAINLLAVDQRKDDSIDLVVFLAWECSSNLGLLPGLKLTRAKFIFPDAGLFDKLDAEGLNYRVDMVFLSGVRSGFANSEQFKTLLNLGGEVDMVPLFFTGDVSIIAEGGSGNGSVTLFSKNEAHAMSANCHNCMVRTARTTQHS